MTIEHDWEASHHFQKQLGLAPRVWHMSSSPIWLLDSSYMVSSDSVFGDASRLERGDNGDCLHSSLETEANLGA